MCHHRDLNDSQFKFSDLRKDHQQRVNRRGFKVIEDLAKSAKKAEKEVVRLNLDF